tara:strand:- start:363 stop:977 length:615 start_codon:yes stop_codon:yes gene_type:complete
VQEQKLCNITLGESVAATDPCYSVGTEVGEFEIAMKPGEYEVRVARGEITGQYTTKEGEEKTYNFGERVARLRVIRKEVRRYEKVSEWEYYSSLGVDSGRMSIWNAVKYNNEDGQATREWKINRYEEDPENYWWNANEDGVWTDAGLGDGLYPSYIGRNEDGEAVALSIIFIFPESLLDENGSILLNDERLLSLADAPASLLVE